MHSHTLLSSPQPSRQAQAARLLKTALPLFQATRSSLTASTYMDLAFSLQRTQNLDECCEYAGKALEEACPFGPVYMQALGALFYAGQDPLGIIANINDYVAVYVNDFAAYLPWFVLSVGFLAYPQDPTLGMEYISRGLELGKDILGEKHLRVARMQMLVGDVSINRYEKEKLLYFWRIKGLTEWSILINRF